MNHDHLPGARPAADAVSATASASATAPAADLATALAVLPGDPAQGHRPVAHPPLRRRAARAPALLAVLLSLPLLLQAAPPAPAAKAATAPATTAAPAVRGPNGPVPVEQTPSPFVGEPFFLLSDASFGSQDQAKVRVEVNSPYAFTDNGGLDVVLYRVPDPLDFLARQRNLHRLKLEASPAPPPLAQALTHLWDNWVVKARLAWRQLFASGARKAVTQQTPELATPRSLTQPTVLEQPLQFKPLPGLQVVDRFRYPLQFAQPIKPPDVKLAGSSSEFVRPSPGNLHLPLGQRPPGLYVVEALAGRHRAQTLVFIADTVALTKVSSQQLLVWTAQRRNGTAVARSKVVWTDGVGVLGRAQADELGVARLQRSVPELSYVFGEDPQGGVFISENFYYDSEIYSAKVYAVTDRPLYRPGDWVQLTVSGREFVDARESRALPEAPAQLSVYDPAGQLVHVDDQLRFAAGKGLDTRFQLPDNATGGGYEIRLSLGRQAYAAAFRVAEYQKPHFEIQLVPDKADFRTGEAITGQLQLSYPDGKPVTGAQISLSARAQQLSMVEGELGYAQAYALTMEQQEVVSDARGQARFRLPAADQPSRFVLTALATDGAAWRVRVTRELLVERGSSSWSLQAPRQFSGPGEMVNFRLQASGRAGEGLESSVPVRPASWEWIRLESRTRASGPVSGDSLILGFAQPGSYSLLLKDSAGRVVGAGHHWVSGAGLVAPAGHIQIVTDKPRYRAGETASVLVSFPEPVDQALLTLERDRVEAVGLLGRPAAWLKAERLGPTQWRLAVPVKEDMSPNMTLSVAYVRNGDYVFQNAGLLVEQPRIEVALRTDKAVYGPGETVQVEVDTRLAGQPVAAEVAVGVVDEMIYVLQPEIAPRIEDFYYHPRRNNVRTSASLSFIGYDVATGKLGQVPARRATGNQRAIKLLERPRRDDTDTAAWQPRLQTDAQGRARFSFAMPDALTRWRITGRAMDGRGRVGQQLAWLRSDKAFYAKWTAPDWLRSGDQAQATLALFNQTGQPAAVQWQTRAGAAGPVLAGAQAQLQPGINHVQVALPAGTPGGLRLLTTLSQQGSEVDRLETTVQRLPTAWLAPRALRVDLSQGSANLALPADASRLQVSLSQDPAAALFSQRLDELIDYPWGCVEQTASRLLPLGLALQSLAPGQEALRPGLQQRLATARLRLAAMADPKAGFGWWGLGTEADPFLTLYAYYADARALQVLGTPLPAGHGEHMLETYARGQPSMSSLQRALALGWMQELGLPVSSLLMSLAEEVAHASARPAPAPRRASLVLTQDGLDLATVVVERLARTLRPGATGGDEGLARATLADLGRAAEAAARRLQDQPQILSRAGLIWSGRQPASLANLADWLERASADQPTIDRAQALVWLQEAAGRRPASAATPAAALPELPAPWKRGHTATGMPRWQWPAGEPLPQRLALAGGGSAAWAWVSFDSASPVAPSLPVRLERSLWRVVTLPRATPASRPPPCEAPDSSCGALDPGRMTVRLERVEPGSPVDTRSLYLDRIEVLSERDMKRVLTEVALPPGAQVESTTWGLDLEETRQPLEAARHQTHARGYALPIDALDAGRPQVFRHLVRFAQHGRFVLPPARLHRMYDPEAVALESPAAWPGVDVR